MCDNQKRTFANRNLLWYNDSNRRFSIIAKTIFEQMGGSYTMLGDYHLPNLTLPTEEESDKLQLTKFKLTDLPFILSVHFQTGCRRCKRYYRSFLHPDGHRR